MLSNHVSLPGSYSANLKKVVCSKCGQEKVPNDGVYMGSRFTCGSCWRRFATASRNRKGKS